MKIRGFFIYKGFGLKFSIENCFRETHERSYKRGEVIYRVGDEPKGLYLVESGLVGLVMIGEKGQEHLVRLFRPLQIFGHRSLFAKEPYHATATALEGTRVRFLNREMVREEMKGNCEFAEFLLETLAHEMRRAEQKQLSLSEKDVTARIAETLLYLKELKPDHNWTRQEIADYCGSTAATVIRTMAYFENQKWIEQVGRTIVIKDKNALLDQAIASE